MMQILRTQHLIRGLLGAGYHCSCNVSELSPMISDILTQKVGDNVCIKGWVKNLRIHKNIGFVTVTDGSNVGGIQCVVDNIDNKVTLGSSIEVKGVLSKPYSTKHHDAVEVSASSYSILGECSPMEYPLQKKHNSIEYLRSLPHLRPRSPYYSSVLRIRDTASMSIHQYLHQEGCVYVHTPIITSNDCEGAGDTFSVIPSSLLQTTKTNIKSTSSTNDKNIHICKDDISSFFNTPAYLTVSGQLQAEMLASALSRVYTFGPTFRAENSNSARHLSEFWMIEPELMWANMTDLQDLAEHCIKYVIKDVLNNCSEEVNYFDKMNKNNLDSKLQKIEKNKFLKIPYTEAVSILQNSKQKFVFPVEWGCDLQTEHERYLTDIYCEGIPVFITDYPKEIKPFYMKMNNDHKTVQAMDLLVPQIGELIGGSVREEQVDKLINRMIDMKLYKPDSEGKDLQNPLNWYIDLRRYGSVPHGGWGMGFERLIVMLTGCSNIRDVIPVPRAPHLCDL